MTESPIRPKITPKSWVYPTGGPQHGPGTSLELALAASIAYAAATTYNADVTEFFVAGPGHEGLGKGAVSINWPGSEDWAIEWPQGENGELAADVLHVRFEALNGYTLAAYVMGA